MPAMPSFFRSLLRYCLACCLAVPSFACAMHPLWLDEGWRTCGNTPSAPASLQQLVQPGLLLCVEREVNLAATPNCGWMVS